MYAMLLVTVYQGIIDVVAWKPNCMGGHVGGWDKVFLSSREDDVVDTYSEWEGGIVEPGENVVLTMVNVV